MNFVAVPLPGSVWMGLSLLGAIAVFRLAEFREIHFELFFGRGGRECRYSADLFQNLGFLPIDTREAPLDSSTAAQ